MDTTLTGVVVWNEKTVYVNGTKLDVDDVGGFSINVSQLLAKESRIVELDKYRNELEQTYTFEQIKALFSLLAKSVSLTITEVSSVMNIDRHECREVLQMGLAYEVLCKWHNCTWRVVNKIVKDRIVKEHKEMTEAHIPKEGANDILRRVLSVKPKVEEVIEVIEEEPLEEIEEISEAEINDEPAVIKVGMKGVATKEEIKLPIKKNGQKQAVTQSKELPTQKPLIPSTGTRKKSPNSAKIKGK